MQITLKAARVNANLTLDEVSKIVGISRTSLQKWERGTISPNVEFAKKLCELYKVKVDDIFFGKV